MKERKKGFTVVELTVVVAILFILLGIVLASVNKSRSYGRDQQIRAQVQTIKLALARAAQANPGGNYPGTANTWYCLKTSGTCNGGSVSANSSLNSSIINYFPGNTFPMPPLPANTPTTEKRYNSYIYNPNWTPAFDPTGIGGPTLIWWQEKTITAKDCGNGYIAVDNSTGVNYCHEHLQ